MINALSNPLTVEKMQQRVDDFKLVWVEYTTPEEKNKAFRTLVDKIVYERVEDGVTLEVLYK